MEVPVPDGLTNPMTIEDLYQIAKVIPDWERYDYQVAPPVRCEPDGLRQVEEEPSPVTLS